MDCGFLCLLTDRYSLLCLFEFTTCSLLPINRRRYCEILWRRRLLITSDEKKVRGNQVFFNYIEIDYICNGSRYATLKAKRRFLALMRGFDTEDLDVLRRVRNKINIGWASTLYGLRI